MNNHYPTALLNGRDYQEITAYDRLNMPRHAMDWSNVPRQVKTYTALPEIALDTGADLPEKSFWQVMEEPDSSSGTAAIDIRSLSTIFRLADGYTARQQAGNRTYLYRSVPSAGALYPGEIYLAGKGIPGLPQGLFYYNIKEFCLKKLRGEDASALIDATLAVPKLSNSRVSFVLSGIFFRSSWKYRERAFRYVLLDTGHLLENLLSSLAYIGAAGSVRYDFDDGRLCALVGLNRSKEGCFAIVDVPPDRAVQGVERAPSPLEHRALEGGITDASRVSSREVTYDAVERIYYASSESRKRLDPKGKVSVVTLPEPQEWYPVERQETDDQGADYAAVIQRRRSRRNFVRDPIPVMSFMRLLGLIAGVADFGLQAGPRGNVVTTGFLAGCVEGFDPGFYRLSNLDRAYGLLKSGLFIERMAGICLDQRWLGTAGALFVFMANLKALEDTYGTRGYRYAMLDAGRLGHRLYLGSTALDLGCCGIGAFYDKEAKDLLSLNDDSYLLYLVAVGQVTK